MTNSNCGFIDELDVSKWSTFDEGMSFNDCKTTLSFSGNENQSACITIEEDGRIMFSYTIENNYESLYYSINGEETPITCPNRKNTKGEICISVHKGDIFCIIRKRNVGKRGLVQCFRARKGCSCKQCFCVTVCIYDAFFTPLKI